MTETTSRRRRWPWLAVCENDHASDQECLASVFHPHESLLFRKADYDRSERVILCKIAHLEKGVRSQGNNSGFLRPDTFRPSLPLM
jgi:hypothetical protein